MACRHPRKTTRTAGGSAPSRPCSAAKAAARAPDSPPIEPDRTIPVGPARERALKLLGQWQKQIDLIDAFETLADKADALTTLTDWGKNLKAIPAPLSSPAVEATLFDAEVERLSRLAAFEALAQHLESQKTGRCKPSSTPATSNSTGPGEARGGPGHSPPVHSRMIGESLGIRAAGKGKRPTVCSMRPSTQDRRRRTRRRPRFSARHSTVRRPAIWRNCSRLAAKKGPSNLPTACVTFELDILSSPERRRTSGLAATDSGGSRPRLYDAAAFAAESPGSFEWLSRRRGEVAYAWRREPQDQ